MFHLAVQPTIVADRVWVVPQSFRAGREALLAEKAADGQIFVHLDLLDDKELVPKPVTQDGKVSQIASAEMRGDGDIVFANSTCFSRDLMNSIAVKAGKLKSGSIIITLTQQLNNPELKMFKERQFAMSWGPATAYFHVRI